MNVKNVIKAIPLSTVAASTLTGVYVPLNSGLPFPCFHIRITSTSTTSITVSYDGGVTDHDIIPLPGGTIVVNGQTNSQPQSHIALFAKGTVISIKGAVGTGNIYLSGYYQPTATQ